MEDGALDFAEIWKEIKPFAVKYRYWFIITPVLGFFLGNALFSLVPPQWEAFAEVQIGKISKSEYAEPPAEAVARLASAEFADLFMKNMGGRLSDREEALFRKSFSARQINSSGLIGITVRGFSKESTSQVLTAAYKTIEGAHAPIISGSKDSLAKKLDVLEGRLRRLSWINGKFKNSSSVDSVQGEAMSLYIMGTMENRAEILRQDFDAISPTNLRKMSSEDAPVYPRKRSWSALAGFLGLFLGIAGAFVHSRVATHKNL